MIGTYELNQIYTGDCRELCKGIPDQSVKLAFADPPYWVGFDYKGTKDTDMDFVSPEWIVNELTRISEVVCITPGIDNEIYYPKPLWKIIWIKPASTGRSRLGGFNTWEPVLVYGQPAKRFWQDTITAPGGREVDGEFHPCPKPTKLLISLIDGFTQPGDIVIDIFAGSGTTAKAAKMLDRHFLCFELNPDFADQARRRVANTQPPLVVFQAEQAEQMEFAL